MHNESADNKLSQKLTSKKFNIRPVVLCGGSGTRLWPLSRPGYPKQFLDLVGGTSLFQLTANRISSIGSDQFQLEPATVVAGEDHRFLVTAQLAEIGMQNATVLLEPCPRNTAPALTLAALAATADGGDPILVVMPSDHIITDEHGFLRAISKAIVAASDGSIVTLGIKPSCPETGYGYIKVDNDSEGVAQTVIGFFEKPDEATAAAYLKSGKYCWNAGIFVVKADAWLSAIDRYRPDVAATTRISWQGRRGDLALGAGVQKIQEEDFKQVPSESIDYAVMEHASDGKLLVKMVPLTAGWSDLGAWDAVWDAFTRDTRGNVGKGDVFMFDTTDSYVHSESRFVGVVGAKNLAVIETSDAVLVVDRKSSQDVKRVVEFLAQKKRPESDAHRKVRRPWGWYDAIDEGDAFKVKRISVNPGASLSLQKHAHRSEHWVVVKGVAEVLCGQRTETLQANSSIYIPAGEIHRLSNPGVDALEIIEVQTGSYLGEDDIVRLEDNYGRTR